MTTSKLRSTRTSAAASAMGAACARVDTSLPGRQSRHLKGALQPERGCPVPQTSPLEAGPERQAAVAYEDPGRL